MTEPAETATPGKLAKAEEVIAEYVQRYGFTASAREYFGSIAERVCNDNVSEANLCLTEAAVSHEGEKRVERSYNQGSEFLARDEYDKLNRLRDDLNKMREERDLLAKAAAWFARNEMP